MRIIVYTGKGGVGKTSIAAATAVRSAQLGYRTVVLSTDLAHSLGDSLDLPLTAEPTEVAPNLWAQETDIYHSIKTHWGTVQEWLNTLMRWGGGVDNLVADELTVLPGMDELANLLWINDHRESGKYDVIVVDAAPTGETLRLLSFPDVMRWWIERIFPMQRRVMKVARPFLGAMVDMPLPSDKVMGEVEGLFKRLDTLHEMLVDPELTSIRLVLNPEKMVVAEAQRTYTYFNLFSYPADMVIANRVLPEEVTDPYFAAWKDTQATYLKRVEEGFSPLPIKRVPMFGNQVVGLEALSMMAKAIYGDEDPTQIYFKGKTHHLRQLPEGGYELTVPLPFAQKGEIKLAKNGDELFVHVGSHRRHIVLPRSLVSSEPSGARLDEESSQLVVRFDPRADDTPLPTRKER